MLNGIEIRKVEQDEKIMVAHSTTTTTTTNGTETPKVKQDRKLMVACCTASVQRAEEAEKALVELKDYLSRILDVDESDLKKTVQGEKCTEERKVNHDAYICLYSIL